MALVNLYSDTQTRPTAAMRAAIAAAEVGDEQRGEDPTTRALEERVAALLGHEAAVFLPSGTMCNEIAIRLHIRPGGERMFIGRATHPLIAEAGGPAQLSGAVITEVDGDSRHVHAAGARATRSTAAGPAAATAPRARLVCVEQTTNMGGGRVWPLEQVRGVLDVARARGPAHPPRRRAADERGRGQRRRRRRAGRAASTARGWTSPRASAPRSAPAWPARRRSSRRRGAGSRCSAARCASRASSPPPGLYALDHHVERLADDHARARRLAEGLAALPGVELDPATVETNIVIFDGARRGRVHRGARAARGFVMSHFGAHARARGDAPRRRRRGHRPARSAAAGAGAWA